MAQAITNTVKSNNTLSGLLGLSPKPLASNVFGSSMGQSTAATLPQKGLVTPAPAAAGNSQSMSSALVPGQFGGQTQAPAVAAAPKATPITQAPVAQQASQTMTTPSGMPVTGNPATFSGAPAAQNSSAQPVTIKGLFPDILSSLVGLGSQYKDLSTKAQGITDDAGQQIADVGQQGAKFIAGQKTTGTSPVAEGNAAVTAQTTAAQQQAIAQGAQVQLGGIDRQITGLQNTASALNNAGGLSQPNPAQYGQTVFDPVTGTYSGGGGLPPEVMQQYAQMAAQGQYSAIPSFITSNPVLSAQLNAAAKSLNPNYTPLQSVAQGASVGDLTNQVSSIQSQANGAEKNFDLMVNIARQGGVNDVNVPILNNLQNNVNRGLTSSAAVANFQSLIQSVRSQYAAILGGGTVTVEALQEAQTLVPNDISISALQSLGAVLKADAQNRVQGINQQIDQLKSGTTSGTSNYNTGGGEAQIQVQAKDGNSYGFYQDANGVWHAS